MMRWVTSRLERLLYLTKQLKNAELNDFHRAGPAEYRSTFLSVVDYVNRNYYWTPPLQRIRPSLDFIEKLEDMQKDPRYNPFSFRGARPQLMELVDMVINEAFTPDERAKLLVDRNTLFPSTPFSALHGCVDYFIEEPASGKALAVLVAEKQSEFQHDMGFFTIGAEAAVCFLQHYNSSYHPKPLHVITTNGHQWQLWYADERYQLRKTKVLGSNEFLIFEDIDVVQGVVGMVRYPLIRFANEELLDNMLEMNDQAQGRD